MYMNVLFDHSLLFQNNRMSKDFLIVFPQEQVLLRQKGHAPAQSPTLLMEETSLLEAVKCIQTSLS